MAQLATWTAEGRRGIWLKVPIEMSALVEPAVTAGFVFHHAEAGYAMLTKWLPTDSPSPLPANASTQVGVGAVRHALAVLSSSASCQRFRGIRVDTCVVGQVVLNQAGQVLLVQEAVGPTAGKVRSPRCG